MIPDLFKNAKMQYEFDGRERVYSVKVTLDNRPRIITMRIGENFTELSISDLGGNPIEILRQEEGKGVTFSKTG